MHATGLTFEVFLDRLRAAGLIRTQADLAQALGVDRSAITQAKRRDQIPEKWLATLARRLDLSPRWLESGVLPMRMAPPSGKDESAFPPPRLARFGRSEELGGPRQSNAPQGGGGLGPDFFRVPLVEARLSAGGGSLLTSSASRDSGLSFRRDWLARKGPPERLALMQVMGDSMEPELRDGDLALVDQSPRQPRSGEVWAAALSDAVVVKRLELRPGLALLLSDNPAYGPVVVQGDELDAMRLIGKVVWSCRDWS